MKTDLIIFAGQSNMQGQADRRLDYGKIENAYEYKFLNDELVELKDPIGENITYDFKDGYSIDTDKWEILSKWLDTHALGMSFCSNTNLVPYFVNEYGKSTNHKVIAIHTAKGSTTIDEWKYDGRIYRVFLAKVKGAINKVKKKNINHIYFVWYQGESDAIFKTSKEMYIERLIEFKNHLKKDIGIDKFGIIKVGAFTNDSRDDEIKNAQEEVLSDNDFVMLTRINDTIIGNKEYMSKDYEGHLNSIGLSIVGKEAGNSLANIEKSIF